MISTYDIRMNENYRDLIVAMDQSAKYEVNSADRVTMNSRNIDDENKGLFEVSP